MALASAVESFVLPLLVIALTRDPALAGTVAALGTGARLVTTLHGGVLADRHDLRRLMVLSGASGGAVVALMAMAYAGGLGVAALAGLALFSGARAGLLGVASNAALKQVVPPGQLPAASSANQARDAAVQMGGGPLGGVLLAFGAVVALASSAGSYLLAALAALRLRGDFRPDRGDASRSSALRQAAEGIRWLWAQAELRRILVVSLLLNLGLSTAVASLIYDLGVRGVDPVRIGLVSSALGAGMIVGAFAAAGIVNRFPSGWVAMTGMAVTGAAVMVLPWVNGFGGHPGRALRGRPRRPRLQRCHDELLHAQGAAADSRPRPQWRLTRDRRRHPNGPSPCRSRARLARSAVHASPCRGDLHGGRPRAGLRPGPTHPSAASGLAGAGAGRDGRRSDCPGAVKDSLYPRTIRSSPSRLSPVPSTDPGSAEVVGVVGGS